MDFISIYFIFFSVNFIYNLRRIFMFICLMLFYVKTGY